MTNENSDIEIDGIFELRMVENRKRNIKGYLALITYMVLFTHMVLFTSATLFTYTVWWCGIDRWRGSVLLNQWCGVDWWGDVDRCCGRILLDQNTDVALTDDVAASYWTKMLMWYWLIICSNQSKLAMWHNLERPNCFHPIAMIYLLYLKIVGSLKIWHPWIHFWAPFSIILSPSCIFYVF